MLDIELAATPMARVRADIRRVVSGGADVEVWDAVQVSDELVSNTCRHARSPRTCRLPVAGRGGFRVEVDDVSTTPGHVRRPDHTGGRGLHLVAQLASRGEPTTAPAATVWAELGHPAGS
ncbi:hypothetical protein NLM24_19895 [Nocardia zapadnayensis]|uniref:hypothetical protein n=1 Tax=Nocardia rhamnosiphila TaxID=426716 RepID=UPI00224672CA|nr:hypothetical protein [Nocardia zapadnayensis]MCX0272926.1 hypothetical protein [Nocardia zapadnayensis]